MYFDRDFWEALNPDQQRGLEDPCVRQAWQIDGIHSDTDYTKDFRRLADIDTCK
jgi:hypothetical protein